MDYKTFKSGSDIRGVAIATENGEVTLTDEVIRHITNGFYAWLNKRLFKPQYTVAVGHDSRLSASRIKTCVIDTLKNLGVRVLDLGLSSTPSMFMITIDEKYDADAAIQITASHHPFDKNGLKFFTPAGGLEGSDIAEILQYAQEGITFGQRAGSVEAIDFLSVYARGLVEFVRNKAGEKTPLKGMKIIVDAGNGAGGFYADKVLVPLGADTTGSQFLEPDGNFPNHVPNPENKAAMKSICNAVKKHKADIGIIFDTDVDRAGAVDRRGNEINRNRLIALISAILLKEKSPATIVTDSVTSDGLTKFIVAMGGTHHRFKRGYKNVINECIRLNNDGIYSPLAIETSGHAALKENHYLDDGAYLVTRILAEAGLLKKQSKTLQSLTEGLKLPIEEEEVRLSFYISEFLGYSKTVLEHLESFAKSKSGLTVSTDSYEGVRISFDSENGDGFCLLRMSVHDPILPVNIESNKAGGVKQIAKILAEFLQQYNGLNVESLNNLCK